MPHHAATPLWSRFPRSGLKPASLALALATAFGAMPAGLQAQTLPSGGVAVHGQAVITQPAANQLRVVTQNGAGTSHSAINWQSFSISAGAAATIVQPSASSLSINRVVTNTPSAIFGNLSSNGRLVLVNQSGIAVGAGAVIDTAGFTASALRMSDADALAGRLRFGEPGASMGGAAGLTVGGTITAREGDIVLVAPNVDLGRSALLQAPDGNTILAAGQQVEISGRGLEGITMLVQAPTDQVRNLGRLEGSAVGIFAGTLRHSGEIRATTASLEGGTVVLRAAGDAYVEGAGSIDATGTRGGKVDVLGNRVAVMDQAIIDVSGDTGGGNIRIGGDYQGKNPAVPNALRTYLGPDAQLRANAGASGDGGRVIVWGDEVTRAYGAISARGGLAGGNGGFAEVSGLKDLVFEARVDLRAPKGLVGTLLLDPDFIDISASGSDPVSAGDQFADPSGFVSISPAALQAVGGNVMLQSNGDISFSDPVNLTTPGASLTALAGNAITVGATITTNGGNITLQSAAPGAAGTGSSDSDAVYVNAALTSNGGTITLAGNSCDLFCDTVVLGANVNAGAGAIVINAPGGDVRQSAGAITASALSVNASQTIDLNGGSNNITGDVSLTTDVGASGSGQIVFHNGAVAFNLSNVLSKDNITIAAAGAVTTDGVVQSTGGNVSIVAWQGLALGDDVSAAGTVYLETDDTALQQTGGAITAGGLTTILTNIGSVNLGSSGNTFNGLALTGGDIIAGGSGLLTVTALSQAPNSDLFLSGSGGLVLPAQAINVGTGQLVLSGGTAGTTTFGALAGAVVTLSSSGSGNVTVAHNINASEVHLDALGSGNISQSAGSIVTPGLLVAAANGGGTVTLNQAGNDFGQATLVGSAVSVTDATSLSITGVSAASSFSLTTNGAITQSGAISAPGTSTINAGTNGAITLFDAGNNFGTVGLTGGVVQINDSNGVNLAASAVATSLSVQAAGNVTQSGALLISGTTNVQTSGNVTLTTPGNNLNVLSVSGNAINVVEGAGSSLTVTALNSGPNQPVSLAAGHTLTLPGSAINTGAADLTLSSAIGPLTIPAPLTGNNISLSAVTGLTVNAPIAAAGDFTATVSGGASTMTVSRQVVASSDVTLTLAGNLTVSPNAGLEAGFTSVGNQTINAGGNILLQGGASGSNNRAVLATTGSAGTQSVTANGITLQGGNGSFNYASIQAAGAQNVTVGNGGITLTGGTGSQVGTYVEIDHLGPVGTGQLITVNGTGSISLVAGSAAGGDSEAAIRSEFGGTQTITFTGSGGGRAINITGGTVGSDSYAEIWAGVATQLITGAGLITLTGGASGGGASFGGGDLLGNVAAIAADVGNQTIVASGMVLQGGAGGLNNLAGVFAGGNQLIALGADGLSLTGGSGGPSELKNMAIVWKGSDVPGTTQTITVSGGGAITLQGGSASGTNVGTDPDFGGLSNGAFAAIRSEGTAQLIEFLAPGGSIELTGGTVGSDNHAMIFALSGTQTIRGSSDANAPDLVLSGGASGGVGGVANEGNRALIYSQVGNQSVTAGNISLTGGIAGNENLAQIRQGDAANGLASTQAITVVGGGDILLTGGDGNTNFARIRAFGTSQTVGFTAGGAINATGGSAGVDNLAQIVAHNGDQTVTGVTSINLQGGSGGTNSRAQITAPLGSQTLSVGSGGLTLIGGSGTTGELSNYASVFQGGTTGEVQSITVGGGGNITLAAGDSASTSVGTDNGSLAYITSQGDGQLIEFSGAGSTLSIIGGTNGSRNEAGIGSVFGSQTIRGTTAGNAPAIVLIGGADGGQTGESNLAQIIVNNGAQSITARSISLEGGGAGGTENIARIRQGTPSSGLASNQFITITAGGSLSLQGGSGVTNLADIRAHGPQQTIDFSSGGSLSLTGGDGVSLNYARIESINGNQTISGLPSITVTGGASGGLSLQGNFASLQAGAAGALQTIDSGAMTLNAGAAGTNNFAFVGGAVQDIAVSGNLALNGGGSAGSLDGTLGGGARIGAPGTGATNLTLDVTGNLTMTGGSVSGVAIGAGVAGGGATNLDITVGGNVTLAPGSVSTAGARIGSPSIAPGGGNILVDAGGSITLGTVAGGDTGVVTTGNVLLEGNTLSIADGVLGHRIELYGVAGVSLTGFATIAASDTGDALKIRLDSGAFSNTASANPLNAPNGRWLVFSVNPANDTRGNLVHDFKQYDAVPGDAILGSGNGLLYSLPAPTVTASLVGPVSKTYDGTDVATLSAGNYSATGIDGDVIQLNNPSTGTYDTKDVGSGKSVVAGGLTVVTAVDAASKPVYGYNQVVAPASGLVGDIGAATITAITGISVPDKVYDTTTVATLVTTGAVFDGLVTGDTLALSGATGAFDNENVGNGKTVTVTGLSLGGAAASNYLLAATSATTTGNITPATISAVTGITAANKVYDGDTGATLTTTGAAFSGRLGSDVLTVATAVGNFSDKNVANPKTVNITGLSLGGAAAGNYTLANTTATTAAAITPASITAVAGITATKVYDGTTSATAVTSGATFTGAFSGDNLTVTASGASFSDKNVGTGKLLTATGLTLGGTDAANYSFAISSATGTGTITQRPVSTWTGSGGDGLWSNPLNWDALPDGSNVATASIPASAGTVIFDGAMPATTLQTLAALSPFTMGGSSLSIGSTLAVQDFGQSGGALSGAGSLVVSNSFSQGGGSITMGNITIVQNAGNLSFSNISGSTVALIAPGGAISQSGPLVAGTLTTSSDTGTTLTHSGNQISNLLAENLGSGAITVANTGPLDVLRLDNAGGDITVSTNGALTTRETVSAAGSVSLAALGSGGNLEILAPVTAGDQVVLSATGALTQDAAVVGTNGVTADAGTSIVFGAFATANYSPVVYRIGGLVVASPPEVVAALPSDDTLLDPLVEFVELLAQIVNPQPKPDDFNPDGTRKKSTDDTIVTEGEVCN